jgi:hypothetical protein
VSLETFGLKDKTKLNLYFDIRGRLEGYQTVVTKKSMLGIKYPYQKSCEGLQKVSDYYGNDL